MACSLLPREAMDTQRSVMRAATVLVGESLREMAVLLAVFAPLDILMQGTGR